MTSIKILDKCLKMSASLENRSSLRKLEFPSCTVEALSRLYNTLSAVSHKMPALTSGQNPAAFLVLTPKETELVLDIINEFVFFTKSKSRKVLTTQLQELQLLQIIIDFYQTKLESYTGDSTELCSVTGPMLLLTNYLFMENHKDERKYGERAVLLSKVTSLAVGLKSRGILHCIGLYIIQHGSTSDKSLQLVQNVSKDYLSLVQDMDESLNKMPNVSAVFAVQLLSAMTELHGKILFPIKSISFGS